MLFPLRTCIAVLASILVLPAPVLAQEHFTDCLSNNVYDASVVIPTDATITLEKSGDGLSTGDEVALFSNDGQCAGVAVWDSTKEAISITVTTVDSTASILEGFETGEKLKYRIWRASDKRTFDVTSASYDCSLSGCRSDGQYERNAIYEVTELDASTPLPVEITSFEATQAHEVVVLTWETTSETNNSGFRIQHRANREETWSTLTFVDGAGTTSSPQNYKYNVEDLEYGAHHFRLAQIDRNGAQTNSEPIEVELTLNSDYKVSDVSPNPVRRTGTMDLTVKESQSVSIRLYDVLGRQQSVLLDEEIPADQTQTVRLQSNRLSSGQYFVRVVGEDFQETKRVTVVK